MKLDWQNKESAQLSVTDNLLHPFLFHEDSLTQFIIQHCAGEFKVELISEKWQLTFSDEADYLSLSDNETAFIRKVMLKDDDKPLVYARSIIPEKTLSENKRLLEMGNKPLGDFLFNDTSTFRSDMRYAKIPVNCELHKEAIRNMDITSDLWGRQSLFFIEQKPLLVNEVFLPTILK